MKLSRLETHDRLQHFVQDQSQVITMGIEDCLKRNPDALSLQEKSPYIYVFAHPRTADDGLTKRMLWQPRLSRPEPQENSYLFRVESKTQNVEVCWMIPPRDMWKSYKKGNVTESEIVTWSIDQFQNNKAGLEAPHPDDMSQEKTTEILRQFIQEKRQEVVMKNMFRPISEAEFSSFL